MSSSLFYSAKICKKFIHQVAGQENKILGKSTLKATKKEEREREQESIKMTTQPVPSTKERLSTIVGGFDGFESDMKTGTRVRREKDEQRIAALKAEMGRLDGELVSEIKRRTEMNKSTEMWFEENMTLLNETFTNTLNDRYSRTNRKLDTLNDNLLALEDRFLREKSDILELIDRRGAEIMKMLTDFKAEFKHDQILRLQREEALIEQLIEHEEEIDKKFEEQTNDREKRYQSVKNVLEDNIQLREKAETRTQRFFENEVNRLLSELKLESQKRENEDDEIVDALNRYTLKLQNSLKVINATDL